MKTENQQTENVAGALNQLLEINNDRVEGYKKALHETDQSDLKDLFKEMAEHSFKIRNELANEVIKLNQKPSTGTSTSGKVFRAWMDLRAALTQKDRKAILSSCEFGEDAAQETYESVLKSDKLAPDVRSLISQQKEILRQDHNKVKGLRDSVK